jgi:hypothetical protein
MTSFPFPFRQSARFASFLIALPLAAQTAAPSNQAGPPPRPADAKALGIASRADYQDDPKLFDKLDFEVAAVGRDAALLLDLEKKFTDLTRYELFTDVIDLKAAGLLDHEAAASQTITARVTDQAGLSFDKTFSIAVTNVNEAPTALTLTGATVAENSSVGVVVGTLAGVDPDFQSGVFGAILIVAIVAVAWPERGRLKVAK